VVKVGMAEQDCRQCAGIKREGFAIASVTLFASLKNAAIHQHRRLIGLDKMARTRHFSCGAAKLYPHLFHAPCPIFQKPTRKLSNKMTPCG
jgi:hypothetical protein